MNRNSSTFALAAFLLLAGLGRPALAENPKAADPVREARRLIEQLRVELKPVNDQITNAPYLAALETHQVSLDNLRAFVGEQYYIARSDFRSNSLMLSRFGSEPHASFFVDGVTGGTPVLPLLLEFGRALGLSEQDLRAYEPRPLAQTYPSYVTWLALYGSQADIAAAYLINSPAFGANVARMGAALRNVYGFPAQDLGYFDYNGGTLPPSFEAIALNVIQDGLNAGASPADIRRSARLLQAYEKDFWDAVALNP